MGSGPRLLLIDENIRSSDGHYLELANLLMDGAVSMGFRPTLATNRAFDGCARKDSPFDIVPAFRSRMLRQWSLGVDGSSYTKRDLFGNPCSDSKIQRWWHQVRDPMSRRERRPNVMLREWSTDLLRLLDHWQPGCEDHILINTADDFVILALANAMNKYSGDALRIRAIFHFAVYGPTGINAQAIHFGEQVNQSLQTLSDHDVSLFATTEPLSKQLGEVGIAAPAVPYPTRPRASSEFIDHKPLKILMAGMPRAEKGRGKIPKLLSLIHTPHLSSGDFQLSMQMRQKRWRKMIPPVLHDSYRAAVESSSRGPLEIITANLPGKAYHDWLGTADVGLFLYDADRYVARCSGVLLEMFVAGIPVIVPAKCWLGDEVLAAGGNGCIGYVYESIKQIPELLTQVRHDYRLMRERASERSRDVIAKHSGESMLRAMNLPHHHLPRRKAS